MNIEQLAAKGYRRISAKHGTVARIDRPDWVDVLAEKLRRSPAEFYLPGETRPAEHWAEHYLRCFSKDVWSMSPDEARELRRYTEGMRTSYVPPPETYRPPHHGEPWTAARLRALYDTARDFRSEGVDADSAIKDLAAIFGRTPRAVELVLERMGVITL